MATGLVSVKGRVPLPLKDVSVEAEIRGYVLGLKSTLKYENTSSDPVEVQFRFPLEQSHAVVGLTALIDGRKIRAELKEKEEAKQKYDDAIASGQTAAYAEEKSGDIFSVSLGNLPPQKEAEIVLQLVGELPIDAEGEVRFSLPATLKPRYTPLGSTDPLEQVASDSTSDQVIRASTSSVQNFKVAVFNQEEIEEVSSPTHAISVSRDVDTGTVNVSGIMKSLQSDLVILVKHKHPHAPKTLVEPGEKDGSSFMKQAAVMVNFFPEFPDISSQACEFIFLVDRSGSMSGSFMRSAKETLLLFLKSLPEECLFNIVGFGSSYEKLFKKGSVPYSQATLDTATTHINKKMFANLGGTELLPPLKDILGKKSTSGMARQVFVLTDGAVSNTRACIDIVKKNTSHSRCFTFGIGSGASTELVEGLARAGNGSAEFIKGEERMQPKVIRSLKRAMQPAATNVNVDFNLTVPNIKTTYQCPSEPPTIYFGEKLVVYGLADVPAYQKTIQGTAILTGEILGKRFKHKVPFSSQLNLTEHTATYPVHRLAAKILISDWQNAGNSKETITSVSVESSVISSYTAFVAVDEENFTPVAGALRTWDLTANMVGERALCYASAPQALLYSSDSDNSSIECMLEEELEGGIPPPQDCLFNDMLELDEDDDEEEIAAPRSRSQKKARNNMPAAFNASAIQPFRSKNVVLGNSATYVDPGGILDSLIGAQQADGSWKLDEFLSTILSKSMAEIKGACPVQLDGNQVLSTVWATVLVLAILETKCNSQQEEWELLAMKADKWLKRQAFPTGADINSFKSSVRTLV